MTSSIAFVLRKGHCNSNDDGLFIAWDLFNAFLSFLIVFFVVVLFFTLDSFGIYCGVGYKLRL